MNDVGSHALTQLFLAARRIAGDDELALKIARLEHDLSVEQSDGAPRVAAGTLADLLRTSTEIIQIATTTVSLDLISFDDVPWLTLAEIVAVTGQVGTPEAAAVLPVFIDILVEAGRLGILV